MWYIVKQAVEHFTRYILSWFFSKALHKCFGRCFKLNYCVDLFPSFFVYSTHFVHYYYYRPFRQKKIACLSYWVGCGGSEQSNVQQQQPLNTNNIFGCARWDKRTFLKCRQNSYILFRFVFYIYTYNVDPLRWFCTDDDHEVCEHEPIG